MRRMFGHFETLELIVLKSFFFLKHRSNSKMPVQLLPATEFIIIIVDYIHDDFYFQARVKLNFFLTLWLGLQKFELRAEKLFYTKKGT